MDIRQFHDRNVEQVFSSYPDAIKTKLLFIRELIFQIAAETEAVGEIEETLKWDEPSYLTRKPKSGTTIRLSTVKNSEQKYAICVHCQTSLISDFKAIYPKLNYAGTRSIVLDLDQEFPLETIKHFILMALSYHIRTDCKLSV